MSEPTDCRTRVALFLPNLSGGGAERVMTYLANGLVDRGHQVDMLLIEKQGPYLADLSTKVHVTDLGARGVRSSILPLARYLRTKKPEVLLSALDHVNIGALLAKRLARAATRVIPTVHISHSQVKIHHRGIHHRIVRALLRLTYPWADAIVAVSKGTADDMIRTSGVPERLVRVIYNPVITQEIKVLAEQPLDYPWFGPGEPPVILAMGRLTEQKAFGTLIRAFSLVQKDYACRLLILGEGPDRKMLEGLVDELDLTDKVSLPGFVRNPFNYMARCSLFVLSSAWEALPTVLIEALSLGTPVVSTDCPSGPREILYGGQYGRLVPVGDVETLAGAMNDTLRGARPEVPESALRPFTVDVAVDEYIKVIREVTHA